MFDTEILFYVLLALAAIVLILLMRKLLQVRVWISTAAKPGGPMTEIGYLEQASKDEAAEVRLPGSGSKPSIGRVVIDDNSKKNNGYVEILSSDFDDESVKPQYRRVGYIGGDEAFVDEMGIIFKQGKKGKKEQIGYTACPSAPNTATMMGERSWKTLWLVSRLNVYLGKPNPDIDAKEQEAKKAEKSKKKDDKKKDEKEKDNQTPPSPVPVAPTITDGGEKKPIAELRMYGFHNSKHDALSVEGRAGAYALLAMKYRQRKYTEYYKGHPYGWKDTAMLTSLVFTVMFLLLYVVNTGILHKPLLGNDLKAVFILIGYYFMLWSIVRSIKIDCVENSNSFQPKLDLFNKNLGLKHTNWSIIICGLIAIYFTFEYYDYGFIPLIVAIIIGVTVNMTLSGANSRWRISTSYREDDYEDEDEEETEVKNPDGDIAKTYDWDLDSRNCAHKVHGNLTLYFYANDVKDMRQCNPFYSQRSDKEDKQYIIQMFNFLKEHKSFLQRCRYIVDRIYKISDKNSLSPLDRIQFTLDFIQEPNIAFCENKDCAVINSYENYIRYPDETLYDKQGDANSKSLLGAILFHLMGYNVLYMASRKNQHSAIGVELPKSEMENGWYGGNLEDMMVEENGHKYLFCETTGDKFSLGAHIKGMSLDEFEERIVLPVHDEDEEEEDDNQENGNSITRVYQWTLDSWMGNKLDGQIALDFTEDEIYALRQKNPFLTYGQDQNTYEMNITSMFKYIFEEESRHQRVKAVADYIRQEITSKGYPTLDLVQFALDFAQKPNIEYCIDENSKGISYAKEYMRFPDEVMFDKEGDCDCKSSLTAALFHCLGYNVIFMLSKKLGHAAIGIEVQEEWLTQIPNLDVERVVREYNGRNYIYCETTSDGFKVGKLNDNEAINDFEKIVEIPV